MNKLRLRAIIIKIQDRLSDDDRKRLHFFLGNDVPRRIRDDPSLGGTLGLMESLFDQDKINEEDFTFLIDAFDEIQCIDAVKLLREHMKRIRSDGFDQSMQSLSLVMPALLNDLLEDQDDKFATETRLIDQTSIYGDNNTIISHKNINNNPVTILINSEKTSASPLKEKKLLRISIMKQKCLILFILLTIILTGVVVGGSIWLFDLRMKYKHVVNKQTKENETITNLTKLLSQNKQKIEGLLEKVKRLESNRESSSSSRISNNSTWKQHGITIAGGNKRGNQSNELSEPHGIYIDDDNQSIYIADYRNHRIVKWRYDEKSGEVVAGENGKGNRIDQLNGPTDVTVDKKNNSLIICDCQNRRVIRWSLQNNKNQEIIVYFIYCFGVTMDNNGDVYVSDFEKKEVTRWKVGDKNGTLVAGGNGEGEDFNQLGYPTYVFVDEDYSVYVSDSRNRRVMKWMKDAKEGNLVAGGKGEGNSLARLSSAMGVIVDHFGNVYVADMKNDRIMRWLKGSEEGNIIVGRDGRGNKLHQLDQPFGLSFDREGNLYVVDSGNHRVEKFLLN